jgi:hypothetical protein
MRFNPDGFIAKSLDIDTISIAKNREMVGRQSLPEAVNRRSWQRFALIALLGARSSGGQMATPYAISSLSNRPG